MSAHARYVVSLISWTAAILCAVAAFNFVVDPYGVFGVVDVRGFNHVKAQASERGVLFKRSALNRVHPNGLILGNSRAEIGFDPESAAWPDWARPVFNLALPGAGISTEAAEFARALERNMPRIAIVGLDFLDFRVDGGASDGTGVVAMRAESFRSLRERASVLLTMNALIDSVATVKAQHDPYSTALTDTGFNPMLDYVGIARRDGYFAMFRQRDQENAIAYLRGPKRIVRPDGRPGVDFDAVDRITALAREHGIKLRFVLYPYHAHTLILFDLTGLWPAYEDWKRELTRRVDVAQTMLDVELWDFTGFSPYSDEKVPKPGTTTQLTWYWEGGHFKKALGDALIARMLDHQGEDEAWGRRLSMANLSAQIMRQRLARDEYTHTHPDDVADLRNLVDVAMRSIDHLNQAPPAQ
jgi:hypothetical protein